MKTIVAIGGGELRKNETLLIDKYIAELASVKTPRALFIPTASGEPQGYIDTFNRIYGTELGCTTDVLKILTEDVPDEVIHEKILSSNIIYVGGGNTVRMLNSWRERNVDKHLRQAYDNGIVLAGLSAGAICWFKYGFSDSFLSETGGYNVIEGLDFIPAINCPHYNERGIFDSFMTDYTIPAIAVEDNCAVVFRDNLYKSIKSDDNANAFLIKNNNGIISKEIINNQEYLPLQDQFLE